MHDLMEKGFYTTLGAWLLVHEKADEILKEMVAKGKAAPEEGRTSIDDISQRVDEEKEEVKQWLGESLASVLRDAGAPTKQDLDSLSSRLEEIEDRLAVVEAKEISIEKKAKR